MRRSSLLLAFVGLAIGLSTMPVVDAAARWPVCGEWRKVTTPETVGFPEEVAVVSPSEAWFVGSAGPEFSTGYPAVMHWTGLRWERERFRIPRDAVDVRVHALHVVSATNVWAVGEWRGDGAYHPLVARWDGERWSRVWLDLPGLRGGLSAVTMDARSGFVWAIGAGPESNQWGVPTGRTVVLRWNGLRWHRVSSPSPGTASQFQGVVTISGDLWAVGSYERSGQTRTLAARLRDGRWRVFLGPRGSLQAVDATSRDLVWAVGPGKDVAPQRGFVTRWDGARWTRVLQLGRGSALQDVAVTSSTDAWAVGYRGGVSTSPKPAIVRRHGGPWKWARPPHVEGRFWAVDGTAHNLWALRWLSVSDSWFLDTFHRC